MEPIDNKRHLQVSIYVAFIGLIVTLGIISLFPFRHVILDTLYPKPATDARTAQIPMPTIIPLHGPIGIVGDSNSDEYRADDNREGGTSYANTTLNWLELLQKYLNVYPGDWSDTSRGEPRRKGYANNWARSAATSASLLASGQHTGLAGQISSGQIALAGVFVGSNDFAPYPGWTCQGIDKNCYQAIYDGSLNGSALQNYLNSIVSNITTAVDTLLQANPGNTGVVIVNILDWNKHPAICKQYSTGVTCPTYTNASYRQRVTNAINQVNTALSNLATSRGVAYADINTTANQILLGVDPYGYIAIGGAQINVNTFGGDPRNGFLSDIIHMGTVFEGKLANSLLTTVNSFYGTDISLFSDTEIRTHAGITLGVCPQVQINPTQGASVSGIPVLTWEGCTNAVRYQVQVTGPLINWTSLPLQGYSATLQGLTFAHNTHGGYGVALILLALIQVPGLLPAILYG